MSSRSVPKVQRADCSGHITAVGTGLMLTALVFFLFYLLSGPPTFLTLVQLSGGSRARASIFLASRSPAAPRARRRHGILQRDLLADVV